MNPLTPIIDGMNTNKQPSVEEIAERLPWRIFPSGGRHRVLGEECVKQALHQAHEQGRRELDDLLYEMWGILCNVQGGMVENETPEWYEAFNRVRKKYFDHLSTKQKEDDK